MSTSKRKRSSQRLNGFPDLAAVRRAVVPGTELDNVETLLRRRETELTRVKEVLADPEVVAASHREAVNLEVLASDCSEADQACAAQRAASHARTASGPPGDALRGSRRTARGLGTVGRSHQTALGLAALCAGTSPTTHFGCACRPTSWPHG